MSSVKQVVNFILWVNLFWNVGISLNEEVDIISNEEKETIYIDGIKCIKATKDNIEADFICKTVEKNATYPEGAKAMLAFIYSNIKVNDIHNVSGSSITVINFEVDRDGIPSNYKILKGDSIEINKEVLRVIKLIKKWNPSTMSGIAINSKISIPIRLHFE